MIRIINKSMSRFQLCVLFFLPVMAILFAAHVKSQSAVNPSYAPPSFSRFGKKFVPIDIVSNRVSWQISSDLKATVATAVIIFRVSERGFPFLLLNPNATGTLMGSPVAIERLDSKEFQPANYFALMAEVEPGKEYRADLKYSFTFDEQTMKHFLPLEYYNEKFVEQGIPANGPYDRFPLHLKITVEEAKESSYQIIANGIVTTISSREFEVMFPSYFTSMSFYIDIMFTDDMVKDERILRSVDGRKIKLMTYASRKERASKWISTFAGEPVYS